ncbi:MAG: type I 3-dehydroquinate dehydratase [Desulfovibrionaceae bacterium]|nr:type I 3-dehydroquinate dehydratase [Desulfovibrionaceae bacterium]
MIIGVLQKKTLAGLREALAVLDAALYDLLELRLDALEDFRAGELAALRPPRPCIFTLRRREEGGSYQGDEKKRLRDLAMLARLRPAYLDLEASMETKDIAFLRSLSPGTRLILSRHDFTSTPANLDGMLDSMRGKAPGAIYKIATLAKNSLDALRLLAFCKRNAPEVLGIAMGRAGENTRILAPVYHCGFCYCPVEESSAPGQIPALALRQVYNFDRLTPETRVYGLLGDPVEQSQGHILHNALNLKNGDQAVYVKWKITKEELPESLELLHRLGVSGLSVTMPHKEAILPLLAQADKTVLASRAANTLIRQKHGYAGTNTDGEGALRALRLAGVNIRGEKTVILGAGGAARSLILLLEKEINEYGGSLLVFNRSAGKAIPAKTPPLPYEKLEQAKGANLVINALPLDLDFDFSVVPFSRGGTAMDLSYGSPSAFLQAASGHGCRCLDGAAMFREQAMLQREAWGQL